MVKLAQIQAGQFFDLFQAVNQSVAVDEQLSGGLRNIQIVLKELVDGKERFLIQRIDGVLLEHFAQEDLAQSRGELIDQTANAKILIIDDALLSVEHLAHINGSLGFLVRVGQLPQMLGHCADADDGLNAQLISLSLMLRTKSCSLSLMVPDRTSTVATSL